VDLNRTWFDRCDMTYTAKVEVAIAELTPKRIHEIMKRHIDVADISIVVAGDFDKEGGE
jgi:hypothetical protein